MIATHTQPADTLDAGDPVYPLLPARPPAPGIYEGLAESEYHRIAAWSKSSLIHVGRWDQTLQDCVPAPFQSPSHLRAYLHGRLKKSSKDLEFGSLYHAMLFEPWTIDAKYHRLTHEINMRTNAGKAEWKSLVDQFGEDRIITDADWKQCAAMVQAMAENELARELVGAVGRVEVSGFWRDTATGLPCRFRLDKLVETPGTDIIIDLKTTRCSHWSMFAVDVVKYGYDVQMALEADGYEALTGRRPRVVILAQEKTPDYPAIAYDMREDELAAGRVKYRAALRVIDRCQRTGQWPGYVNQQRNSPLVPIVLPEWGMAEDKSVTETEGADRE